MTFSEIESASFGQPIPSGILRWYAILGARGVSAGDLKRGTQRASRLRSRFWSNPNAAHVDSFEWVSRWAGTTGAGRALRISWPAKSGAQAATFLELLDKRVIGGWEDLHAVDRHGLLFLSVTHERMVSLRTSSNPPVALDRGEVAEPEFIERLQKAP